MEFCPTSARRTHECNCQTRVISHGNQGCFAITRMTFESNLLRIDGLVCFKIINCPAHSPCPGSKRSPVIHFSRLSFIHKPDDPLGETSAIVSLNAGGNQN